MPGRKKTKEVGPWPRGLNEVTYNYSNEYRNMEDGFLPRCMNFEITDEGWLVPRRAFRHVWTLNSGGIDWYPAATGLRSVSVLGSVKYYDDEYAYIVAREAVECSIYATKDAADSSSWVRTTSISGTADYPYAMVQYKDNVYICRSESNTDTGSGGWSFPSSAIGVGQNWTSQPNIPKGNQFFVWKDRLWITSGTSSKISFSMLTGPTTWAYPDGGSFFVSPGDGEVMTDCILANNQMFIFKERKSFRFIFGTDPNVDGTLLPINDSIGGMPIAAQDRIFLVSYNGLYQVIGDQFINISHGKINDLNIENVYRPFIVQNTMYFGWRVNNVDVTYTMNLNTGAFSLIDTGSESNLWPNKLSHKSARFSNDVYDNGNGYIIEAYEYSKSLWTILDDPNYQTDQGIDHAYYVPPYDFTTKMYDFDEPFSSKKIKRVWLDGQMVPIYYEPDSVHNWFKLQVFNDRELNSNESYQSKYSILANHPSTLMGDQGYAGPLRARSFYFQWAEGATYQFTPSNLLLPNGRTSGMAPEKYEIRRFIVDYVEYEPRRS